MSGDGVGTNAARSGASDGAVLFDRQYVWPGDLTEIPDWVYTDEAIYQREIERIFHGPTWNYVALEAEIPNTGDFIRSHVADEFFVSVRLALAHAGAEAPIRPVGWPHVHLRVDDHHAAGSR